MTILELLDKGTKILLEVDKENARLDATLLLGHIIGRDRLYILIHGEEKIGEEEQKKYLELIEKRKQKMPIKYILGTCEFMGLDFYVEEGVLIPRGDTEILVEEVLKHINEDQNLDICDLCSGSGAIGVSLAYYRKNINVDSIDYFKKPKEITIKNIKKHNLEGRMRFVESDLLECIIKEGKKYDIIVSNPPYIREEEINNLMDDVRVYEPHTALSGGEDGLIFYRRIVNESKLVLKQNGILAFEIGHDQGMDVKTLMEKNNFKDVRVIKDLAGHDRVVIGCLTIIEKGL